MKWLYFPIFALYLVYSYQVCATDLRQQFNTSKGDLKAIKEKLDNLDKRVQNIESKLSKANQNKNIDLNQDIQQNENLGQAEIIDYNNALAQLREGNYQFSEQLFAEFINKYPNSHLQSNAFFWYGETFYKRTLYEKAALNYLAGYKKYPEGVKASDSLLKLACALGELKKIVEACKVIDKLEEKFPAKNRTTASIKRADEIRIKYGCR